MLVTYMGSEVWQLDVLLEKSALRDICVDLLFSFEAVDQQE